VSLHFRAGNTSSGGRRVILGQSGAGGWGELAIVRRRSGRGRAISHSAPAAAAMHNDFHNLAAAPTVVSRPAEFGQGEACLVTGR